MEQRLSSQATLGASSSFARATAVNSHQAGVLKWVVGDCEASRRHRSQETFRKLWSIVRGWCCFLYITDGYPVYPCCIDDCDHLVSKTAMTTVEGENSRLRHYLGGAYAPDLCGAKALDAFASALHRKTFCYSKSVEMLEASIRLLTYYLKHWSLPVF